jgi:predicted double-glycine peptidase
VFSGRQFRGRRSFVRLCALGLLALAATQTPAQVDIGSGLRVDLPSRSMKDLRDANVVRQRFDFSCGAAALATMLRFGFGEEVTEGRILDELFGLLSEDEQATARETGFSLLNLQQVAQARGYRAAGFRLQPDQIAMLGGPVIVYIEPRGYRHFAVLRGVRGDRVYLADPSRGNIRMPVYAFMETWVQADGTGIIFVVEPASGLPDEAIPLALTEAVRSPPEIMSAREMLAVGNVLSSRPER